MNMTKPHPQQEPDLQLLTSGQTVELMSRLLGAAIHQLGGTLTVHGPQLRELDGLELQQAVLPDGGFVVRLTPNEAETEAQALAAGEAG